MRVITAKKRQQNTPKEDKDVLSPRHHLNTVVVGFWCLVHSLCLLPMSPCLSSVGRGLGEPVLVPVHRRGDSSLLLLQNAPSGNTRERVSSLRRRCFWFVLVHTHSPRDVVWSMRGLNVPSNTSHLPPRHHHDTAQAHLFDARCLVFPTQDGGRMRNTTSTLHYSNSTSTCLLPRCSCLSQLRLLFIFSPPTSSHANTSLTTLASQTHKQATKHTLARHHASPRPVERHPSPSPKRPCPAAARNATHHGLAHPAVVVESVEPHQQQQQQQEKSSSNVLYFSSNSASHAMLRHLSRRQ